MKKTIASIIALILVFTLFACGNIKQIKGYFVDLETYMTTIEFSVEIVDPKEEITGNVIVEIYKEKEINLVDSKILYNETDYSNLSFRNLEANQSYKIVIKAMIGRKSETIEEIIVKTKEVGTIYIKTVDDFIKMNNNPEGIFILENDLDFEDDTITTLFSSSSKSFKGSFDGQGYTIKNFNINSVGLYGGLFGYIDTGVVKNLNIENFNIGTIEKYVTTSSTSKVGLLAGLVYSNKAVIENITIKNSSMYISSSSTNQFYVGGLVGDLRSQIKNITIENSVMDIKTTNDLKLKLGGVAGYVDDNAAIRNTIANIDIKYSLEAKFSNVINREFILNIGGIVGDYNSRLSKGLSEIIYEGNIEVNLDFGTNEDQEGNYRLNLGGIAGVAYGQMENILTSSNITVNHDKNEYEENSVIRFYVGGITGYLETNHSIKEVLFYNIDKEINLNISDDVSYYVSYTTGYKAANSKQTLNYFNQDLLFKNGENIVENTVSERISDINEFFSSNFINEYLK